MFILINEFSLLDSHMIRLYLYHLLNCIHQHPFILFGFLLLFDTIIHFFLNFDFVLTLIINIDFYDSFDPYSSFFILIR